MLAMAPDLVRTDTLEEAVAPGPRRVGQRPGVARFYSFSERAPDTGVRGDPRPATAAKGEAMIAAMAEALAAVMRDPLVWRRPDAVWTPGRGLGRTNGPA